MLAYTCYREHVTTHIRDASPFGVLRAERVAWRVLAYAYAGHGTIAQHWTGTLFICTHTIPVGPGTHIYGVHACARFSVST
jgi:hypothetical protein